ncbi:MAG: hypothetical protein HYV42_05840, partial [Candidatus Magasanikbacteria bacterium]|nr:hypothetical protein [Candidatus Magasanikbacteria bacterium]
VLNASSTLLVGSVTNQIVSSTLLSNSTLQIGLNTTTFRTGFFWVDATTGNNGNTYTSGTLIALGQGTLGGLLSTASSTINANLTISGPLSASSTVTIGGNLLPSGNNSLDLGAFGTAFRTLYASTSVQIGAGNASTTIRGNNLSLGTNTSSTSFTGSSLVVGAGTGYNQGILSVDSLGNFAASGTITFSGLGTCDTIDSANGVLACGTDAGGSFTGRLSGSDIFQVTDGTTTSTLTANLFAVATSSNNLLGLFSIDSSGNASASGTLRASGTSTFTGGVYLNPTATSTPDQVAVGAGNLLQTPGNPRYIGGINYPTDPNGVASAVVGRYLYALSSAKSAFCSATTSNGCEFKIFDIANITNPQYVGGLDLDDLTATDLAVNGRYAYVTVPNAGGTCSASVDTGCELRIIDISNPASPEFVGGLALSSINSVSVSGRLAYLTQTVVAGTCSSSDNSGCEFLIYDVSSSTAPTFIGGANLGVKANEVFVRGRYAYVVANALSGYCSATTATGCELQIFDILDPKSPVYAGGADTSGDNVNDVYVSNGYAYIATAVNAGWCSATTATGCELKIYNVTSPSGTIFVGGVNVGGSEDANNVSVAGRYAYVGKGGNTGTCSAIINTGCELQVYDVASSTHPLYVGGADNGDTTTAAEEDVFVAGRYVFMSRLTDSGTCSSTVSTGCELQIYDVSGIETTGLIAHSLEAGVLQVQSDAFFGNQLTVAGGLSIGLNGISSMGALAVMSSSTTSTFANGINITGGCFALNNTCIGGGVDAFNVYVTTTAVTGATTVQDTWNAPAGIKFAQVIVTAGGGAGGSADGDGTNEGGGGGGGAGGTSIIMLTAAQLGSSQTLGIGGGGAPAAAAGGGNGGDGGYSYFGTPRLVGANFGAGGTGYSSGAIPETDTAGGAGGAASSTGDINIAGANGEDGFAGLVEMATGGEGGGSYWGGGGVGGQAAVSAAEAGAAGHTGTSTYGSGGGGAASVDESAGAAGGAGGGGVVVVLSYTASGGDLAEWYETKGGVVPGDVVAIGQDSLAYTSFGLGLEKTSILEKATPGSSVVGVVSSLPFQVMGGDVLGESKNAKPIALAGRVPVKVSNENGKIKAGDQLTVSSIPGVAKRATKAGVTIGRALEDADCRDGGVCKVLVLVNTSYSTGLMLKGALQEDGIDLDTIPTNYDIGRILLAKMIKDKKHITASSSASEIFTDRVAAGLELVAPRVVTDELVARAIEPVDDQLLIRLPQSGRLAIETLFTASTTLAADVTSTISFTTTTVASIDARGNAFFAGTVQAGAIKARQIFGLEIFAERLAALASSSTEAAAQLSAVDQALGVLATSSLSLTNLAVSNTLVLDGSLLVAGEARFAGRLTVAELVVERFAGLEVLRQEFTGLLGNVTSSLESLLSGLTAVSSSVAALNARLDQLLAAVSTSSPATTSTALTLESLNIPGSLTVAGATLLNGGLTVDSLRAAGDAIAFNSDVNFIGRPYFNADSGGFVVIASGTRYTQVKFEREYLESPVVNATIALDATTTESGAALASSTWVTELVFANDLRYVVTNKSTQGFTILLNRPAPTDINFSWIALAVKNPRITISETLPAPDSSADSLAVTSTLSAPLPITPEAALPADTTSSSTLPETTTPAVTEPASASTASSTLTTEAAAPAAPATTPATSPGAEETSGTTTPSSGETFSTEAVTP